MAKQLLALTAILAGAVTATSPEIAEGQTFIVTDDHKADQLIDDGLAELSKPLSDAPATPASSARSTKQVRARVLVDGSYGKCNQVVTLPADVVKHGEAAGQLDSNKAAVDYALTLA